MQLREKIESDISVSRTSIGYKLDKNKKKKRRRSYRSTGRAVGEGWWDAGWVSGYVNWARAWTIGFDCGSCSLTRGSIATHTDNNNKRRSQDWKVRRRQPRVYIYPGTPAGSKLLDIASHTFQWYQHDERRQARHLRRRRQQNDMDRPLCHTLRPAAASR